jgi:hypothetical protein
MFWINWRLGVASMVGLAHEYTIEMVKTTVTLHERPGTLGYPICFVARVTYFNTCFRWKHEYNTT